MDFDLNRPDDQRDWPAPPEDPAERELRERYKVSRGTWNALKGEAVSIDDYKAAVERDRQREERRGRSSSKGKR